MALKVIQTANPEYLIPKAVTPIKAKPTIGGTILGATTQIGKGVLNAGERAFDAILQAGTSKYNPFKGKNWKENQLTAQNIVRDDSSQELLNKVGYDKVRPSGMTYQQELDAKSAIKSTGKGGQILESIGEQLPNIVLGNLGSGTAAKTAASILPTALTSYGGGIEQAYQAGANRKQANLYGGLNAAVETATEFITGGVPGVETGFLSGLDTLASKGIGKVSNAVTRSLIDAGYKIVGESFEEALAEIMNPIIKNASYSNGEKVDWKNVVDSAVQGAIVGGLLNAPSSISNVRSGVQEQSAINKQNKPIIQTTTQPNTITPTTPQTTQGVAQIQPQGQVASTQIITQPNITPQVTTQEAIQPEAGTRQRGVFTTALENQNIPADIKSGIKGANKDYIVITDNDALTNAQQRITDNGYDKSLTTLETKFNNNEKLSKYDIAEATLLYNDAFAKGDTQKALDILTSIAVAGTESGQVSQATSILQRATPDGRLLALQKQVNKINEQYKNKKGYNNIKLDEQDITNIKNSQNKKDLDTAINNAIVKVSKQMPNTLANRLNEWRYLAMLGNPKTHIRNIVSNLAMKGTSKVKNTLSAFIEDTVKPMERTRTLEKPSQQTKDFVNQDVEEQKARIQGTDKYDQNKLGIKPTPSKLSALNSALLEWEDWKFSGGAYKDALSNYITSNKIDVNNATPQQLESARQYAIDQAQEQTFRQFSKLAESISRFGNKNKLVKLATDAVLPFKTTPINIAKAGIEYSPIGLAKTLTKNAIDLKNGNIKPAKFIDNISKGLTGTAITALGYALAEAGLLTASGSDEDKENYFQQLTGKQPYSIQIGGTNITLDWLSPSAMPFFMGAEISEMKKNGMDTNKLLNIASGISTIVDPLTEMSMLQGINSTLKSYDESALGGVVINALQNYALQYIPTVSGQLARTLTPERKSTTGAGTGIEKKFNTFANKVKAKLPIVVNTLEPYVDQFGNKQITNSIAQRAFENFLSPAYIKTAKTDKVYSEIQKLYDKTGETSILPTSSAKYFTKDGQKIYLTPEEYTKFSSIDGQESFKKLSNLFNSNVYKQMNDEAKIKAIESFYKASQKIAKETYDK